MIRAITAVLLLSAVANTATAQAAKKRPATPLQTAIAQFDAERLPQARAMLTPLAEAGDADAMYYLGRTALDLSDPDEAVTWLEKAVAKNDRSSVYHQWLASALGAKAAAAGPMGAMSIASSVKREMERAVELDSTNIEARVNLTQFYLQAPAMMGGGVDRAREQVAILLTRSAYYGHLQEAAVAENQKDAEAAEKILRDLVSAYPDSSAPATRLAQFYSTAKRYDESFAVLEDRLKRSPNDGSALYQLGRVGAVSGLKLDRAQWALESYIRTPHKRGTPTIAGAHWRLGMVREAGGDTTTARAEYETALRLDPKLAGAKTSLEKLK
ncbi:MAG TPA: TRAP transporter TatT component family protein [Gemmatimonadaceae bacterium]|nr:TRAP transporter TatT component family protein [Gemmatimonadaceae bacterium]